MKLSIVVLAAGQGKRMKSDLPKVLQPLAGKPLLQHVVDCTRALEAADVHVVYGHGGERVRAAFEGQPLQWALQAEQLGTGHAVMQAMPAVPDDHLVLVLYGDVPLVRAETLRALVAKATGGEDRDAAVEGGASVAEPKTLALLSVMLDDPTGYGRVLRDNAGNVYRIVEQKDASRKELAVCEGNSGILAAPASALKRWLQNLKNDNAQGEYYLTDVVGLAVREGWRVEALVAPTVAEVLGVNDKVQLAELEAEHRKLRARELMLAGATVIDPARLDVRGEVEIGRDVVLDVNVVFEGRVKIGDRARIGAGCVLRNVSVGADTVIEPHCVLVDASIGPECNVGPFARMRPGAKLERGAHVGNFVEIKNTTLGEGSKANHLTYLGDATIGKKVNVGAGTITCNYDGVNKWPTTIEDGAFIGSGTMLVAPLTIGAGGTTGAGSTITKSAPRGQLTLERAKQQTLPGWNRPARATPEEKAERVRRSALPPPDGPDEGGR